MIEEIFSSKTRVRLIKLLVEFGEVNISEIVRRLGANHTVVEAHLDRLKTFGIVEERRIGRVRLIRLRKDDEKVRLIAELFERLESEPKKLSDIQGVDA